MRQFEPKIEYHKHTFESAKHNFDNTKVSLIMSIESPSIYKHGCDVLINRSSFYRPDVRFNHEFELDKTKCDYWSTMGFSQT